MERKVVLKSKLVYDTTVLCETVGCSFNDKGLCEENSIAIIGGKKTIQIIGKPSNYFNIETFLLQIKVN